MEEPQFRILDHLYKHSKPGGKTIAQLQEAYKFDYEPEEVEGIVTFLLDERLAKYLTKEKMYLIITDEGDARREEERKEHMEAQKKASEQQLKWAEHQQSNDPPKETATTTIIQNIENVNMGNAGGDIIQSSDKSRKVNTDAITPKKIGVAIAVGVVVWLLTQFVLYPLLAG